MEEIFIFKEDGYKIQAICEDKGYSIEGLIEALLYLADEHYDEL